MAGVLPAGRASAALVAAISLISCGPPSDPVAPVPSTSASASAPPLVTATAEPTASASTAPTAAPTADASATARAPASPPPITPGTTVLHIGDSFMGSGFTQALKPKLDALGVKYEVRGEDSSYTVTWAPKMDKLIADTSPDLVILNLGTNEVANTDPPTHAPAIKRIIKSIGDRPCVWVSPPMWRKDTGILNVIREASAPCRYFDSDRLVPEPIPRRGDKIHPTTKGGEIWANAFWSWLMNERAPADAAAPAGTKLNPWKLKPAAEDEHQPKPTIINLPKAP